MESMQLEDYALFNGDLLSVALSVPLTDADNLSSFVDEGLLGLSQDGVTWADLSTVESASKADSTGESVVSEMLNSPTSASNEDLLSSEWLDTRVDLVDYVGAGDLSPAPTATWATPTAVQTTPTDAEALLESLSQAVREQQSSLIPSPVATENTATNQQVDLMEVLAKLTEAMDENFEFHEQPGVELPYESILSPMSVEEVESILSSGPASPGNSSVMDDSGFVDDNSSPAYNTVDLSTIELKKSAPGPQKGRGRPRSSPQEPYTKPAVNSKEAKTLERKLRKKQQNKDAALRYRMKKKSEGNQTGTECEKLESRNTELREKVDSMTREIDYLKNLMAEVYKAKGLLK